MTPRNITVAGAGILGLWQALTLARAGHRVRLVEACAEPFSINASRHAGAMLAPDCEAEAAPPMVRELGREGLALWRATYPNLVNAGTLVVAAARDRSELTRFAKLTDGHRTLVDDELARLEPDLAGRFSDTLFFPDEAHMSAPEALAFLLDAVCAAGVEVVLGQAWHGSSNSGEELAVGASLAPLQPQPPSSRRRPGPSHASERDTQRIRDLVATPSRMHDEFQPLDVLGPGLRRDDGVATESEQLLKSRSDILIDCRGLAARDELPTLRGVRGERLLIRSRDVRLTRPVRLLHPRHPLYVVPWGEGCYLVGATMIESEDAGLVTVRSALELLGTAYALHPAFGEAEILETGAGVRPAFPDNVPRAVLRDGGRRILVNGAFRHGFLLAPVLAKAVAEFIATGKEHELIVPD